jgi:surface antigen
VCSEAAVWISIRRIAKEQGRLTDTPRPGYLVFIDLAGENNVNDYITHVGIVESVEGPTIHTIEGNADKSGLVTRQSRELGDGRVLDFAPFDKGENL